MKFGRYFISIFLILIFLSCGEKKEYNFTIIDLSGVNNKTVDFKFRKGKTNTFKTMQIDFDKKQQLLINADYFFVGLSTYDKYKIFFYPSIYLLQDGGNIEVYLYKQPEITKRNTFYYISPCKDIEKYFLYLLKGEEIVSIISRKADIDISNIISDPDLEITYLNKSDVPVLFNEVERKGYIGGYIVKSRTDGLLLSLD
jgi:hypothetical protein